MKVVSSIERKAQVNTLSALASSKGFCVETVLSHGTLCFDLIRLSDGKIVLESVGSMDVERFLLEL